MSHLPMLTGDWPDIQVCHGYCQPGLCPCSPREVPDDIVYLSPPMLRTTVVNVYARKMADRVYDIYIGRGSLWGNPFIIGTHGDRAEVIRKYEAHILGKPEMLSKVHLLRGKRLGCYCAPQACHGDVLARLADA